MPRPKLVRPAFLKIFIAAFFLLLSLSSISHSATINASFQGGVLNVDWGPPGPENGFWRIHIGHKINSFSTNTLKACGPGVEGFGPCGGEIDANGHFELDYTATILAGGLVGDFWLVVTVEEMDGGTPTGNNGSLGVFLPTPPMTMQTVSGDGQTAHTNTPLSAPLTVKLSRLG